MSRSYKKNLIIKDRNPYMKNQANRKLRRIPVDEDIVDGKSYRKYTESWCISDYAFEYDPNPHIYSWDGIITEIEPDPIYKWRNK